MNRYPKGKKYVSTPERKKYYVQQWLEDNPQANVEVSNNTSEKTPPSSPVSIKACTSSAFSGSPVLGRKRIASSPIIGSGRNISKRLKVVKKLNHANITKRLYSEPESNFDKGTNQSYSMLFYVINILFYWIH